MKKVIVNKDQQRLQRALERQLDWGPVSDWHNSMFAELSTLILEKCKVDLSPTTLKRFFGTVKHSGEPSTTTLDTLSQFVGHENWRSFKLSSKKTTWPAGLHLPSKGLYLSLGFVAAFLVIVLIGTKRPQESANLASVSFSSRPVTNSFPNSVVFDFDLKGIEAEEMYIQLYWDPDKTISISKDQNQATGIYYFPGYYRARLMIGKDTASQHDLFLKSNGWLGTIDYSPVPKYFTPTSNGQEVLALPQSLTKEIETSNDALTTTYHYVNDLGDIDGDNFQLDATIKTNYNTKWAVCQRAQVYVLGSQGAHIVPFSKIGCSSDNWLMLNDNYLDGKQSDLSALGCDLSQFTDLSISITNKSVAISIGGVEIYQSAYIESIGKVVGLRFKFLGYGEVEEFSLLNKAGDKVIL